MPRSYKSKRFRWCRSSSKNVKAGYLEELSECSHLVLRVNVPEGGGRAKGQVCDRVQRVNDILDRDTSNVKLKLMDFRIIGFQRNCGD